MAGGARDGGGGARQLEARGGRLEKIEAVVAGEDSGARWPSKTRVPKSARQWPEKIVRRATAAGEDEGT